MEPSGSKDVADSSLDWNEASFPDQLERLKMSGITVPKGGLLQNYGGFPPLMYPKSERKRGAVSSDDVAKVVNLFHAADKEGVSRTQALKLLACIDQTRSYGGWAKLRAKAVARMPETTSHERAGSSLGIENQPDADDMPAESPSGSVETSEQQDEDSPATHHDGLESDYATAQNDPDFASAVDSYCNDLLSQIPENEGEDADRMTIIRKKLLRDFDSPDVETEERNIIRHLLENSEMIEEAIMRSTVDDTAPVGDATDMSPVLGEKPTITHNDSQETGQALDVYNMRPEQWRAYLSTYTGSLVDLEFPKFKFRRNTESLDGLFWMTSDAKEAFLERLELQLNLMGVTSEHAGSCVIVPGAWDRINPTKLAKDFRIETLPKAWCPQIGEKPRDENEGNNRRLDYSYGNCCIPFERAIAWFLREKWPPNGARWDRFMNYCPPVNQFHASHLCHQAFCILPKHIVWEPADVNWNRCHCQQQAISEREEVGHVIHATCKKEKHEPKCLMHQAALSTVEAMYVTLDVASHVSGVKPPRLQVPKVAANQVQYDLPITDPHLGGADCQIQVKNEHRVSQQCWDNIDKAQPKWRCQFCLYPNQYGDLKTGLAAHLWHDHRNGDHAAMLGQLKEAAKEHLKYEEIRPPTTNPKPTQVTQFARTILHRDFTFKDLHTQDLDNRRRGKKGKGKKKTH